MPMRHPLKEVPLEFFLTSERKTSLKRPFSPSSSTLLSPSKRRILSEEGFLSPEKGSCNLRSHMLFSEHSQLSKPVLRNLDLSSLNHPIPRPVVPHASSPLDSQANGKLPVPRLAPSPEITITSTSRASPFPDGHQETLSPAMLIPREIPAISDRQSIHWPGFDVFLDTHIAIPTSASRAQQRAVVESADMDEEAKENIKPKKRIPKAAAPPNTSKPLKFICPHSPGKDVESVNIILMISPSLSPSKHDMTSDKKEQRAKNKLLMVYEDDVNEVDEILKKQA